METESEVSVVPGMSLSRSLGRNIEESQKGRWQGMERISKVSVNLEILPRYTRKNY